MKKKWLHVWNAEKIQNQMGSFLFSSKYFWILEKNYRYEIICHTTVNSDTYTLFKGPGKFPEYEKKMFKNLRLKQKQVG